MAGQQQINVHPDLLEFIPENPGPSWRHVWLQYFDPAIVLPEFNGPLIPPPLGFFDQPRDDGLVLEYWDAGSSDSSMDADDSVSEDEGYHSVTEDQLNYEEKYRPLDIVLQELLSEIQKRKERREYLAAEDLKDRIRIDEWIAFMQNDHENDVDLVDLI